MFSAAQPQTGTEYLAGLRDDREIFIYGKRVPDFTEHSAFRNNACSLARQYDALHGSAQQDVLTCQSGTGNGSLTHPFFPAPAVNVPYHHINSGGDQMQLFADGDFTTRSKSGVRAGSCVLFPRGPVHGPPPGLAHAMLGRTHVDEWTLLLDFAGSMRLGEHALATQQADNTGAWAQHEQRHG